MKRRTAVILVGVVGIALVAVLFWWARQSPAQVVQILASGGLDAKRAETFVSSLGAADQAAEEPTLTASGSIEGEEVTVVSEFGGRIMAMEAEEGRDVEAGRVLVELDASLLLAQRAEAEAAMAAAEAALADVKAGAHPAEVLAARAQLHRAIAERSAAVTAVRDAEEMLQNPQAVDARIEQAQTVVAVSRSQVEQARAQIKAARVERDKYRGQGSMEEKWLYRINNYQLEAARIGLRVAKAAQSSAQQVLDELKEIRENPILSQSRVNLARGQYEVSVTGVAAAAARLDELEAGASPEEIAVAEAMVAQAEAGVSAVDAQIDKRTLRAPIDGVVTSRSARTGEAVTAGATVLTIAYLDEVKLTVYVPEDKLGLVFLGQEVEVEVDSFPDRKFAGFVSHIAQQAEFTPRNVQTEEERVNMVFAVKVRLPNADYLLKPGMPADAKLGLE